VESIEALSYVNFEPMHKDDEANYLFEENEIAVIGQYVEKINKQLEELKKR